LLQEEVRAAASNFVMPNFPAFLTMIIRVA
jgi:hypothetical protein